MVREWFTASWDKTARMWEVDTAREIFVIGASRALMGVSFSPDGDTFAIAGEDGASIYDASAGDKRIKLEGHTAAVLCAAFSSDGRQLVTASYDGTAKIWDAASGR